MQRKFISVGICLLATCSIAFAQTVVHPQSTLSVALEMAAKLDSDSSDFEYAAQQIALSYWKRGDAAQAFEQVDKLPTDKRLELLSGLAKTAVADGRTELALSACTRGLNLVDSDESLKDARSVRELARSSAEAGDVEKALKYADMLDEGSENKASTLVFVASALARRREKDRAIPILDLAIKQLDGFDEDEERQFVWVVEMASMVFLRLDERQRALALAERANEFVIAQREPQKWDVEAVALLFARLGDFR